jgi:enhancing lycopene biosynthesis protein 2
MVKVECINNCWRITYPSCSSHDALNYSYFSSRGGARCVANNKIKALTLILQQASKLAGF